MSKKWFALAVFFLLPLAQAQSHKGISFQGVIKLPTGEYPTRSGLTVNSRILSPNNCILREEQFAGVNVSNGYINIAIGTGSTGGYDPGFNIKKVMDNSAIIAGLTCLNSDGTVNSGVVSFNPATTSGARKFRLSLVIDSIPVVADFNMRAMAFAINSETLNGKTENGFVNTSANITQTAAENWFASAILGQLLNGTYVAPTATNAMTATTALTANNVSGTVAIANGGTGATTAAAALTSLLPTQTGHAGKILTTDGSVVSWSAPPATPVLSVAGKTGAVTLEAADITDFPSATDARITTQINAQKGQTNGLAALGATGKIPSSQLALTESDIPGIDAAKIISGTLTQNVNAVSVAGTTGSFTNLRIYDGASEYLTMTLPTGGTSYSIKWPEAVGTNGQVLQTDATGKLSWTSLPSAPVLSVAGRSGNVTLSHTDISGLGTAATYNVAASGDATATEVVKGNDSRLTGAFQSSSVLSGDLSGTLPSPLVTKIQGKEVAPTTYTAGQTLRYDGAKWINALLDFSDLAGSVATAQLPTIPVSKGGTGVSTLTGNRLLASDGTGNAMTAFTCGVGQLLTFDASGVMGCTTYSSSGLFANGGNSFNASASLGTNDNFDLSFKTNGSTRVTVSAASGNVGIGTTNPQALLHLSSSSTAFQEIKIDAARNSSGSYGLTFAKSRGVMTGRTNTQADDVLGDINFIGWSVAGDYTPSSVRIRAYAAEVPSATSSPGHLVFQTTPTGSSLAQERVRVTSDGFVGIGTSLPEAKLHIAGTDWKTSSIYATRFENAQQAAGHWSLKSRGATVGSYAPVLASDGLATFGGSGYYGTTAVEMATGGYLSFNAETDWSAGNTPARAQILLNKGNNSYVVPLTATSAGQIGIGTVSPVATLHVVSTQPNTVAHPDRAGFVLEAEGTSVGGRIASKVYSATENPLFVGYRARGTKAAPTALLSGDIVTSIAPVGYDGSGGWQTGAHVRFVTTENWSPTTIGSAISFRTPSNGTLVPIERMRIDHSGNVGIGTQSPSTNLHITGALDGDIGSYLINTNDTDGDARSIFLLGTATSGTRYGYISHQGAGFTANGPMQPRTTVLAGTDSGGLNFLTNGQIGFWVGTGEKMRMSSTGNLGIGTASPSYKLHVVGTGTGAIGYFSNGSQSCSITPATTGNVSCSSDERLKKNIQTVDDAISLENILKLQTVTYEWKSVANGRHTGYIAQEVEKIAPELVNTDSSGYKQVSYSGFIPWITGALKELHKKITVHNEEVEALKKENADLKARLDRLEKVVLENSR